MAFKKKWFPYRVVNSDGYEVFPNRTFILYSDDRKIYVGAEKLAEDMAWALYPGDMRFDAPGGEKLDDDQLRATIVGRIQEAFNFLEWRLDVM